MIVEVSTRGPVDIVESDYDSRLGLLRSLRSRDACLISLISLLSDPAA